MVTYDFRTFPTSHVPVTECDPHPDRAAGLVVGVNDLVLARIQVEEISAHQVQGILAVDRKFQALVVDDDLIARLKLPVELDHLDVHPSRSKTNLDLGLCRKPTDPLPDTGCLHL